MTEGPTEYPLSHPAKCPRQLIGRRAPQGERGPTPYVFRRRGRTRTGVAVAGSTHLSVGHSVRFPSPTTPSPKAPLHRVPAPALRDSEDLDTDHQGCVPVREVPGQEYKPTTTNPYLYSRVPFRPNGGLPVSTTVPTLWTKEHQFPEPWTLRRVLNPDPPSKY